MTMIDRCTKCKRPRERTDGPALIATLDTRYKAGTCKGCGALRFFESVEARDPDEGWRLAKQGMERASDAEARAGEWPQRMVDALDELARGGGEFTSEDATDIAGVPVSSGAVGAMINAAAQRGDIVWTGKMTTAQRSRSHGAMLKVWQGSWVARESAR